MNIKESLKKVTDKEDLKFEEMQEVSLDIMSGKVTDAQIGAFLVALRMKGETIDEIAAAATAMRQVSLKVPLKNREIIDTCGTGGDSSHSFNISTTAAFVAAAAGISVAKHGNRSASGSTGSADLLEAGGAKIDLTPPQIQQCLEDLGIGFMFAPAHHKATKHVFNPRREIGVRTIFNFLGPLTNPASAKAQVIGVFDTLWVRKIASVLHRLGSERAIVLSSHRGMDEIAIDSPTKLVELSNNGRITEFEISPETFGIKIQEHSSLVANSPKESLKIAKEVLQGVRGPAFDIVALNAGAAIYIGKGATSLEDGVRQSKEILTSGLAIKKFDDFCSYTQQFSKKSGGGL